MASGGLLESCQVVVGGAGEGMWGNLSPLGLPRGGGTSPRRGVRVPGNEIILQLRR